MSELAGVRQHDDEGVSGRRRYDKPFLASG